MADKSVESCDVEVDELGLSLLGWQIVDVRARLMTESYRDGTHYQKVTVAGSARFLEEDWSTRFDSGTWAPNLILSLNLRDGEAPPNYERAVMETIEVAAKRPVRFTETSDQWETARRLTPDQLRIRLTAYDFEEIRRDFDLPARKVTPLPVEVIDETTWNSIRLLPTVTAQVWHDEYGDKVRVHAEGMMAFGAAEEMLAERKARRSWGQDATVASESPFEVKGPGFVVEILDDDDFLLEKHEVDLYAKIPVNDQGRTPDRQPRWVANTTDNVEDLAGKPARVVMRILDGDDL
ncbi:hypothetical protein [Verrucosispora sp. WMMC514]|uniref:hypothetical protein n=1 Tax=Verrucosispora sp. WMMC514 TaxID=3015156 RepID=UPI00248B8B99|nr:hypothetical protein [Verrucosispora sp. WMMC514]WBB91561.1 hypothetical protein O7597_00450 [Verrucosispora sp. WMMC514]